LIPLQYPGKKIGNWTEKDSGRFKRSPKTKMRESQRWLGERKFRWWECSDCSFGERGREGGRVTCKLINKEKKRRFWMKNEGEGRNARGGFSVEKGTVVFAPPTLLTVLRTSLPEWDDNRYLRSSFFIFIFYLLFIK
jgi:hypothetical protein